MKKFYILLSVIILSGFSMRAFAQSCPEDVNIDSISRPTCGTANGKFTIEMKGYASGSQTIPGGQSLDIVINGLTTAYSNSQLGFTTDFYSPGGLLPDLYTIKISQHGSAVVCDSFSFLLRAMYTDSAAVTLSQSPAGGCTSATGSITLNGMPGTDSVSWISSFTPVFTRVSSLAANTIHNLTPGLYYVTLKGAGTSPYCYSTDTITVGNSGTACPAATFCATAADPNNLFPDGTFGSGLSTALNGPALTVGKTQYQYQPIGPYSPEDGFYAIANNTFVGAYTSYYAGNATDHTPFGDGWAEGWDHDHWTTGSDSGYMMVVNADYDPNIVVEDTINNLCVGKTYQFSAYIRTLNTTGIQPNETFLIDGIGRYTTGLLPLGTAPAGGAQQSDWHQVGFTFVANSTSAVFSLRNNAPGGAGNDFAIDDIYMGFCAPDVVITPLPADVCNHPPANDSALVTDISGLYTFYQWQVDKQDGNGYVNVGGTQSGVFGSAGANAYYATTPLPVPLYPDSGWTYRLLAATNAINLSNPACAFVSSDSSRIPVCGGPPAPVTFISVKALLNNTAGDIFWNVGDQFNVKYYIVQKSTDEVSFTDLTSVTAIKGSSTLGYEVEDPNLADGTNYYRIESVDNDGSIEYSPVVSLAYGNIAGSIRITNPVADGLTIYAPSNVTIQQATIYDAIGRVVLEEGNLSSNQPTISVSNLTPGFYNIKIVTTSGAISNLRFIKK